MTRVTDGSETRVYTIVNNRGYGSHDLATQMNRARQPELDLLSAVRGLVGNYPELFIDIRLGQGASDFVEKLAAVEENADWQMLMSDYGDAGEDVHIIRRNQPEFWQFVDWLHDWDVRNNPVSAGILDVSEYSWHGSNLRSE